MNVLKALFLGLRDRIASTEDLKIEENEIREKYKCADNDSEKRSLKRRFKRLHVERKQREKKATLILLSVIGVLACGIMGGGIVYGAQVHMEKKEAAEQAAREAAELEAKRQAEEEARIAKENEPVEITITLAGDCTLGTDESFDYDTSFNAYYDDYGSEYFLKNVRPIFEADDVTIINMEGTLTDCTAREDKQFAFKGRKEFSSVLSSSSVEAANMANNHSHDYGEQGYTDTITELESKGIKAFGYDDVTIIDVEGKDIKVGIFGICEFIDHLGRKDQIRSCIQKLKDQGANIIVGVFHWSNELVTEPDSNQVELGHFAIDEGADVVVGHHPHVVQGVEEYKGKMIAYSLGNFCFGGNSGPRDMDTMLFQQKFTLVKGEIVDSESEIIPCSISSEYYYNNYQPRVLEGDEAERVMEKIRERIAY